MTRKNRRIAFIVVILGLIALTTGTLLTNLSKNVMFFMTPSEIESSPPQPDQVIRVGGLVRNDSFHRQDSKIEFTLTDCKYNIKVLYSGILPDLFREGQGIIVTGVFNNNVFYAKELLAKHDEKYVPKELYKSNINQKTCTGTS